MRPSQAEPDPAFRHVVARLLDVAPAALAFTPLTGGVSSDIWRVTVDRRVFCAKRALPRLQVKARWEAPVSRTNEEVKWLRTVRPWIGGQAAEVVANDDVAGIALLRWYAPDLWHNWKLRLLAGTVDERIAIRLGSALGTIARTSAELPQLAVEFANDRLFDALRIDPFFRHISPRYPGLLTLIDYLKTDHRTLVHGDFSPKNVLVNDEGEILILDAETATWGPAGFDPGYLLAHLLLKFQRSGEPGLLEAARQFWSAYRAAAGTAFPALDTGTWLTLTGMLLARIEGKSPVEYLTRPQQAHLRALAIRLLDEPPGLITELLERWPG
jgi:hypothetical protein